jgi:hypothetical protein
VKYLTTIRDERSFATAVAKQKMVKPKVDTINGNLRPLSSEKGAQHKGPVANPRTQRETPSVATSLSIPYIMITVGMAEVKMLLAIATAMVRNPNRAEM